MNTSHMKKQMLCSLLLLHAALFAIGQQTIVQWNFNSAFSSTPPAPSTGTGTMSLIGGVTSTSAAGLTPTDGPAPGNPIGCVSPATQQASGFRLMKTDNTSAQLTLNRGNGGGCLVLCSSTGIPSILPASGINYTANSTYGAGSSLGNAFAVYNTTAS